MTKKYYDSFLKDFLKHHTIDDIEEQIEGELNEFATKKASYWYGNGELIVAPADSDDTFTFVVDRIGFNKFLSLY